MCQILSLIWQEAYPPVLGKHTFKVHVVGDVPGVGPDVAGLRLRSESISDALDVFP